MSPDDAGAAPAAGADNKPAPAAGADAGAAAAGANPTGGAPAAGADKTPAAGKDTTILGGDNKGAAAAASATTGKWPDDWRSQMAGENKDLAKTLERYGTPADLAKALDEAQKKISAGVKPAKLPENATPEQIAQFRKDNGIPEKAEDYVPLIKLGNGMVIGEADKPLVNAFLGKMHAGNASPEVVNMALNAYYEMQADQQKQIEKSDNDFHDASLLELGREYGGELTRNVNGVSTLLDKSFPDGIAAEILGARTAEGRKLGDIPGVVKGFVSLMREAMPGATLVPAGSTNVGKDVAARLNDIKKMMGDKGSEYWQGPKAAALQQEFRDLTTAELKIKGEAAQ